MENNDDILIQETMKEMASITQEYIRSKKTYDNFHTKCESISNSLKCSVQLLNPNPQDKIEELSKTIRSFIEDTKEEVKLFEDSIKSINDNIPNEKERKLQFKEKVHEFRESELTQLFLRDREVRSFSFLVMTLLFSLSMWLMVNSYFRTGDIFDFAFWSGIWNGVPNSFKIVFILILYSNIIVVYVQIINYFAKRRNKINYFFLVSFYVLIQSFIPFIVFKLFFSIPKTGLPAGIIAGAEMSRIMLKIHGYIREKILFGLKEFHPQYAYYTPKRNNEPIKVQIEIPEITIECFSVEIKRFNYYLFCPSLIYRDSYPRLPKIRKTMLLSHILTFSLCFLFLYVFVTYNCGPFFNIKNIKNYYSLTHFANDSLKLSLPSGIALMVAFFLILHSWMNINAELLRHGDRKFYEDYWNCSNFEEFYRKWNMIVHEWLYYYLYNDLRRFSLGKLSRMACKFIVFFISIGVHDIILTMGLGFYYPVLGLFFGGPGVVFTFIRTHGLFYNIVFSGCLLLGPGIIIALYLWEFNLRDAFLQIELSNKYHKYIPRIILMFYQEYYEKLMKVIE